LFPAEGIRWLWIFSITSGQIGMILTFEKDAAVYCDTLHQVFAQLDSRTVEKQNEQLSATAIKYSSELEFAYSRVRVSIRVKVRLGRPYA